MISIPTKYEINSTKKFEKDIRKIVKQGKNIEKLIYVVQVLANGEKLEPKYRNHLLNDNKYYKNCYECHIEPDWLLIYKYDNDSLILLLIANGSHSELFK